MIYKYNKFEQINFIITKLASLLYFRRAWTLILLLLCTCQQTLLCAMIHLSQHLFQCHISSFSFCYFEGFAQGIAFSFPQAVLGIFSSFHNTLWQYHSCALKSERIAPASILKNWSFLTAYQYWTLYSRRVRVLRNLQPYSFSILF